MTFETCWLVIAPAALFGLSLIGWAGLWITRTRDPTPVEAKANLAKAKAKP